MLYLVYLLPYLRLWYTLIMDAIPVVPPEGATRLSIFTKINKKRDKRGKGRRPGPRSRIRVSGFAGRIVGKDGKS